MTLRPLRIRTSGLAVAALLALVACGGGGTKPTEPVEPVAEQPQEPTPPVEPVKEPPPPVEPAPGPKPVIHAFTASEQGFLVSSYAVVDNGEVLLVDAQMIKPDAEKFIEMVKALGAPVKTIFITHAHPDHYLGLEWVTAAFPEAKVVATRSTSEAIAAGGKDTLAYLKSRKFIGGTMKAVLPASVVVPTALDGASVTVGRTLLEILTYPEAESAAANALFEPTTGAFFAGDLVSNNVHLWLRDKPPAGWIAAMTDLDGRPQIKAVYPGHGEPGGPELFGATLAYLKSFDDAIKAAKNQKTLIAAVKAAYPNHRLPAIITFAAPTYFKK